MPRRSACTILSAALAAGLAASGCSGGPAIQQRAADDGPAQFDARALLVLSDVDMLGTAYADGVLDPLAGENDALTVLSAGAHATAAASNSVAAWPGAMDVSADGGFAYVVETRGPAPPGVDRAEGGLYEALPRGERLTVIALADPSAPRVAAVLPVGREPTSISVAADGRFALIAFRDPAAALAVVDLADGLPGAVRPLAYAPPDYGARPLDQGVAFARLAPDGRTFAANIANTHVQFGRIGFDAAGAPTLALLGAPLRVGKWIAMGRWSGDGRHFIVADTGWSAAQTGAVFNGPGAVIAVRFAEDGAHAAVSQARVSLSPEGFDINRTGDLLAVVNMERTYLPDRLPYALFGRRAQASLSLVAFDAATGALTTVDGPLGFAGVLPEDAVFDADGDMIAVAVFHDRIAAPREGLVRFFAVDRSGLRPRLVPTTRLETVARGAHDLAVVP